jgi:hypothetical protein
MSGLSLPIHAIGSTPTGGVTRFAG